jgi:uncharacterized membrane protein
MAWNLTLALIPWLLAVVLFPRGRRPGIGWLVGVVVCVLMLPNAAYVLTDIVHLPMMMRREPSDAVVVAGVLPMFGALFLIGFLAYADAIRRMARWAVERGWLRRAWPLEIGVHALSAAGIYLGRIKRFNSWDLALHPRIVMGSTLASFTRPLPVAGMVVTFAVLVSGYFVVRPVLALVDRQPR